MLVSFLVSFFSRYCAWSTLSFSLLFPPNKVELNLFIRIFKYPLMAAIIHKSTVHVSTDVNGKKRSGVTQATDNSMTSKQHHHHQGKSGDKRITWSVIEQWMDESLVLSPSIDLCGPRLETRWMHIRGVEMICFCSAHQSDRRVGFPQLRSRNPNRLWPFFFLLSSRRYLSTHLFIVHH